MVHTRFDVDSFVAAIDSSDSDVYVTEHSYMAEPYLRSSKANSSSRFVVSTDVSEALVWKATRGLVGRSESVRIRRDELRVAQSADGIGAFDTEEIEYYRSRGVPNATWLDITMPPKKRIDISHSTPRLVFLGDRTWPPNAEACSLLLRWWPRIAAEIPDAELCIVGKPPPKPSKKPLPDGARELGFVDDLDGFLVTCRALAAPIQTGGGVRVKILEAASQGLPVVATSTGLGSLSTIFDIATFDDKNGFVDRCRELLLDREVAVTEGKRLHAINSDRWHAGEPHSTVNSWLRG